MLFHRFYKNFNYGLTEIYSEFLFYIFWLCMFVVITGELYLQVFVCFYIFINSPL